MKDFKSDSLEVAKNLDYTNYKSDKTDYVRIPPLVRGPGGHVTTLDCVPELVIEQKLRDFSKEIDRLLSEIDALKAENDEGRKVTAEYAAEIERLLSKKDQDEAAEIELLKYELDEQIRVNSSIANRELDQINEIAQLKAELEKSKAIPEGYKLVPIEPTEKMLDAAVYFSMNVTLGKEYVWTDYVTDFYQTMLNASMEVKE